MNLFERLDQGRPAPEPKPVSKPDKDPAQRLLDWLQKWPKPTVYTRDILIYGPRVVRNRKSTIDATETLVRHGWLVPNPTNQRNRHEWQIVRKPIIHPTVTD
jgi:hypothetical protein